MNDEFDCAARERVLAALSQEQGALIAGALLSVSDNRIRLRKRPIVP